MKVFLNLVLGLIFLAPCLTVELDVDNLVFKANLVNEWGKSLPSPSLSLVSKNQDSVRLKASSLGYRSSEKVVELEAGKTEYFVRFELLDPELALDLRDYEDNKIKFVVDSDQADVNYPKAYAVMITLLEDNFDQFIFNQVRLTLNGKTPEKSVVFVGEHLHYRQILVDFPRDIMDSKLNDLRVVIPSDDQAQELSLQPSIQKRFIRDTHEVVTDSETTLQWFEGPSKPMSWIEARDWIKSLGDDWRMPTVDELRKLYMKGSKRTGIYGDPLRIDEAFLMKGAYYLWATGSDDGYAAHFDFSRGIPSHTGSNVAGRFDRAIAVKGKDITDIPPGHGRFVRSQESGIILDKQTNLEWMEGPVKPTSWESAQVWLKSLGNGWRAPTIKELATLYLEESKRKGVYGDPLRMHQAFKMEKAYSLWSVGRNSNSAWMYDFSRGYGHWTEISVAGTFDRAVAVRNHLEGVRQTKFDQLHKK